MARRAALRRHTRLPSGRRVDDDGFTLIELLVVILIVSVLVAIAVPFFIHQREKAWKAQMESALKGASTSMESWAAENDGSYADTTLEELEPGGAHDQGLNYADTVIPVVSSTDNSYCIEATHTEFDLVMHIHSNEGRPTEGPCP